MLAVAALGGGGIGAPTTMVTGVTQEKSALPEPSRRGRRYMHQVLELTGLGGGGIVPGGVVGHDWIYRRTNGFRRKGVGSRWRLTQFHGRA